MQLLVPCKLGVRLCDMKLPGISEYVCKGAFAYCLATQARCGQGCRPCCCCLPDVLTVSAVVRHRLQLRST